MNKGSSKRSMKVITRLLYAAKNADTIALIIFMNKAKPTLIKNIVMAKSKNVDAAAT